MYDKTEYMNKERKQIRKVWVPLHTLCPSLSVSLSLFLSAYGRGLFPFVALTLSAVNRWLSHTVHPSSLLGPQPTHTRTHTCTHTQGLPKGPKSLWQRQRWCVPGVNIIALPIARLVLLGLHVPVCVRMSVCLSKVWNVSFKRMWLFNACAICFMSFFKWDMYWNCQ